MIIQLKEIPGLMIDKLGYDTPSGKYRFYGTNSKIFHEDGFNEAISQISTRSIEVRLDRENLAKELAKHVPGNYKFQYHIADALIASEDIFEIRFVGEK